MLALGNTVRRTEAGKLAMLTHSVHGILELLKFAL
jgi:hypothetical protein